MFARITKRLVAILVMAALLGGLVLPPASALPMQAGDTAAMEPCAHCAPMPCKGISPACVTDLGCVFLIGLPVFDHAPVTFPKRDRMSYWTTEAGIAGLGMKPELTPPRSLV